MTIDDVMLSRAKTRGTLRACRKTSRAVVLKISKKRDSVGLWAFCSIDISIVWCSRPFTFPLLWEEEGHTVLV